MQDNPTPPPPPPSDSPDPAQPDIGSRRYILIAASVIGGMLLLFAVLAILMFVFRYKLMPEPWKII